MRQKTQDIKWKQARFSYPVENETIPKWLEKQSNQSLSFRLMIKWFVKTYGFVDIEDVLELMSGEKEIHEQSTEAPPPTQHSPRQKPHDNTLHDIGDVLDL